jgi:hypothetical protein
VLISQVENETKKNKEVLSRRREIKNDGADVTSSDRLLHVQDAAAAKELSPTVTVDSPVKGILRASVDEDRILSTSQRK